MYGVFEPWNVFYPCDQCGARSWVHVDIHDGELCFCVHHYREHADVLQAQHAIVIDHSGRILA